MLISGCLGDTESGNTAEPTTSIETTTGITFGNRTRYPPDTSDLSEGVPGTISLRNLTNERSSDGVTASVEVVQDQLGLNRPAVVSVRLENTTGESVTYDEAGDRWYIMGRHSHSEIGLQLIASRGRVSAKEPQGSGCHALDGMIIGNLGPVESFTLDAGEVFDVEYEGWAKFKNERLGFCVPEGVYRYYKLGLSFELVVEARDDS